MISETLSCVFSGSGYCESEQIEPKFIVYGKRIFMGIYIKKARQKVYFLADRLLSKNRHSSNDYILIPQESHFFKVLKFLKLP